MRVLMTGDEGILGLYLQKNIPEGIEFIPLKFYADVIYYHQIQHFIVSKKPDYIIHAAAISSPDLCENEPALAYETNVVGTANVATIAKIIGAKFMFISSNGVFDGNHAPYEAHNKVTPVNVYGHTKQTGENLSWMLDGVIVRPTMLYGFTKWHKYRKNIVEMVIENLSHNQSMQCFTDIFCKPMYAGHCAEAIWKIVTNNESGIWNMSGKTRLSVYQLAVETALAFGLDVSLIEPIPDNKKIPRPPDTSFDTTQMERMLGMEPLSIQEGLEIMRKEYED